MVLLRVDVGDAPGMTDLASRSSRGNVSASVRRPLVRPTVLLVAAMLLCAVLLMPRLTVPLGPMYWDLVVYLDGATRVLNGQIPAVDFFAPVGPLEYWLFAAGQRLFPNAQPLLLSQWMMFAVTAPPMLVVLSGLQRRSPALGFALVAPFLLFQIAPINVEQYSTFPGTDGYGIYNRHVTEVLYALTAALVFERRQRRLLFVIAWCCTALFFLKVTGFVTAGLLCLGAFLAGRVAFRTGLLALAVLAATLVLAEATLGLTSRYVGDIAILVAMNEGSLLPRFLQAASIHFGIFGSGLLLLATIVFLDRHALAKATTDLLRYRSLAALQTFFDSNAAWLGLGLFAGLFFETQNTGGQAFIFLMPVLIRIGCDAARASAGGTVAILVLVAATALPPIVNVVHRSARALIGQVLYVPVGGEALRSLAQTTQRPEVMERADGLIESYARHRQTYEDFIAEGMLPSFTLYSDLDFQAAWLKTVEDGVEAINAFEAQTGVRFGSIMSLNFVNPFPYLLDRDAPRRIAIGADPFRAVPAPDAETLAAVRGTDLVLYPTCPVTVANRKLHTLYAEGLRDHREIVLTPCWTAYVRTDLPNLPPA